VEPLLFQQHCKSSQRLPFCFGPLERLLGQIEAQVGFVESLGGETLGPTWCVLVPAW